MTKTVTIRQTDRQTEVWSACFGIQKIESKKHSKSARM